MQFWFISALFCSITVFITEGNSLIDPEEHEAFCKLENKLDRITAFMEGVPAASSCQEIYNQSYCKVNKAYPLSVGFAKIPVYCHLTQLGACGDGGWTLVMKIDGTKKTFHYDSYLWNNTITYNLPAGMTGLDLQETKLPTYWNTPFSKICLGMKIGQQINFMAIDKQADSLYSLIADGQYRATTLGRNTWKALIGSQASLQLHCNKEGFNAIGDEDDQSKARIGIIANNQNDCTTCDSRIGFGTGGLHDDSNTCGNEATLSPDHGDVHIKAMGYIFVQ
ncbi:putative skeletal organic matrix protein 5 [Oculina patagonica]